jgi:hypothetical protein
MKIYFAFLWLSLTVVSAQPVQDRPSVPKQAPKATIDMYRLITLEHDTTFVDTSLTIASDYRFNYLQKDVFGLLPLPNEGQPYNALQFGIDGFKPYPESGRKAKHIKYAEVDDIKYYSVATPLTELYFKSVMEQGQNLDAFVTLNVAPELNFSIAYNGLRSLGKYINQLASTGNFRFTTSFANKKGTYRANFHYTAQDFLNGENGGLTSISDFENGNPAFNNRARLEVFNRDAESFLQGKRIFLRQDYQVLHSQQHQFWLTHQINHEYKYFEYKQATIASQVSTNTGVTSIFRFGEAFVNSNLSDRSRYNHLINRLGATYTNKALGSFSVFAEDYRYNYFYDRNLILDNTFIPGTLQDQLLSLGSRYKLQKQKWNFDVSFAAGVTGRPFSSANAGLSVNINNNTSIAACLNAISKIPDLTQMLHQSRFQEYNWFNDFKNEKINSITALAKTKWLNVEATLYSIQNIIYYSDNDPSLQQLVTPKQYDKTINYLAVKASKELRYKKWALDNTLLYQNVSQEDQVLNVPALIQRHTAYYSDYFFKKALYVQTGIVVNVFSKYYMNNYNPVLGEFFIQQERQIGNFPICDFFVNGRIRQTRIFIKAEHLNALFAANRYFATPDLPYRDFTLRVGLVWNFFQ